MSYKVFIDGRSGTTGLEIEKKIKKCKDIEILMVKPGSGRDIEKRLSMFNASDIVFLCLPDKESEYIASKADSGTRIIDASTAHRVSSQWIYGLPELSSNHKELISNSSRVANPGCHATGFILLIRPLIEEGILDEKALLSFCSLTGYSGGGRTMIERYESTAEERAQHHKICKTGHYALGQNHKHLPEIMAQSLLKNEPVFIPTVGDFYRGMITSVPVHKEMMLTEMTPKKLMALYKEKYSGQELISVVPGEQISDGGFLFSEKGMNRDGLHITVLGNKDRMTLTACYDNLGKGASGAAVQNMNLMLGLPEYSGLIR